MCIRDRDMVYLCLDNDDAGNDACDRMTDTLEDMGLDLSLIHIYDG